jgi:predicted metal-binding membrane protein
MAEHKVGTREEWLAARRELVRRRRTDRVVIAHRHPVWSPALLLGAAAIAWAVTVERMRGMDAGPGTDLGALGWYLGIWVTMTAAMMLPSAAPTALLLARISRGLPTLLFTAGYLAAWTAYGLAAYGVFRLVTSFDLGWLAWDRGGPYLAGGAIVAAGMYELTPRKAAFLRRCRSALHETRPRWQEGRLGALGIGLEHGLYCIGCCWGLMVVLFALGVMSVLWMAVVAAVILAEKVLPYGLRLSRVVALALVALGLWVAVSPSSVPGLTEPDRSPSMQMEASA